MRVKQPWWLRDLVLATGFLTRVPMPPHDLGTEPDSETAGLAEATPSPRRLMEASWCFPLVGGMVGAVSGAALVLATLSGLPSLIAALIAVAAAVGMTGALHEDGLADGADGLGASDKAARIAIMRDSRIGTYGVLALIFSTALKVAALSHILSSGAPGPGDLAERVAEMVAGGVSGSVAGAALALVAIHAVSRTIMVGLAAILKPASETGLARLAGRPAPLTALAAFLIAALILAALLPLTAALGVALAAVVAAGFVGIMAQRGLGGYTGDVLGTAEQMAELLGLLVLVAIYQA